MLQSPAVYYKSCKERPVSYVLAVNQVHDSAVNTSKAANRVCQPALQTLLLQFPAASFLTVRYEAGL